MRVVACDGDAQQAQPGGKREEEAAEAGIERQEGQPRVRCNQSAVLPMYARSPADRLKNPSDPEPFVVAPFSLEDHLVEKAPVVLDHDAFSQTDAFKPHTISVKGLSPDGIFLRPKVGVDSSTQVRCKLLFSGLLWPSSHTLMTFRFRLRTRTSCSSSIPRSSRC